MNRFLRNLLVSAVTLTAISPALAESPVAPTVPRGSFHCFRGMPESDINYVENSTASHIFRIGPKLGNSKWDNTDGHDLREVITEGDLKVLVIIVNFQDTKFTQGKDDPNALITEMLNGEDFTYQNATGSANNFYRTVSAGQFNPHFDIYGPVQLSGRSVDYVSPSYTPETNPDGYYFDETSGTYVQKYPASRAVEEAILSLKDEVDFSQYDSNNDGYVDFVYMFYAGKGATTGGNRNTTIWPHAFTLTAGLGAPIELDGVKIDRYACSAELGSNNRLSGIGTFCHEFGHVLGLPDVYDTAHNGSVNANFTAGPFSCMDSGNYNNNEHTPPFFSSYEQYSLEWMLPTTVTGGGHFTMLPMTARKFAYKFDTSNPQEYFLVEARDKSSLDYYLPCHGLAVWHIDFNLDIWNKNTPNNNDEHQRIDLIEADNDRNASSRDGDLFPGLYGICSFTENISPAFKDWSNRTTGYRLTEISRNMDGTVSFFCDSFAGNEMENSVIAVPALELVESTPNSLTVRFPAIENADQYYVSAFPKAEFDGTFIEKYVEGFYYLPVEAEDGFVTVTISGLTEGETYGVLAYAANSANASRMLSPLYASAMSASFENAKTDVYATATADETPGTLISWVPVPEATGYELTVVRRSAAAPEEEIAPEYVDFKGMKMPEDWSYDGTYDNRAKYCGVAAPSVQLAHSGAYLRSGIYEKQIKSISFWARNRYDEDLCHLDVYGISKDGDMKLVTTITDLDNNGKIHTVDFPAECNGFNMVYFFTSTGLDCNIDDINIEFADAFVDLPVADIEISPVTETMSVVTGLESDTQYVAYVTPLRGEEKGLRSHEVIFTPSTLAVSGVDEVIDSENDGAAFALVDGTIVSAADAPYSVYTVDGTCIAAGVKGSFTLPARGLYIVAASGKSCKICW